MCKSLCLLSFAVLVLISGCGKPESPAAGEFNKAEELKANGNYQDALRLYKKAIDIDPAYDKPYMAIANIYDDQLEDREQAADWYQQYIDKTKNTHMKELASRWRDEARLAADNLKKGQGDLADISPKMKTMLDARIADEKSQLEKIYAQKEQSLSTRYDSDIATLKDEVKQAKISNRELQDSVESLTIERDALQKRVTGSQSRDDLADLLKSPQFRGSNKELTEKLVAITTEADQLQVRLKQAQTKNSTIEEQLVRARQELAAAKKIDRASDKSVALMARVKELEDANQSLTDRLKVMESSVAVTTAIDTSSSPGVTKQAYENLQQRLATLDKELADTQAQKFQAEQALTELKARTDAVIADTSSPSTGAKAEEENRKLRLQIASLTTEFNQLSDKNAKAQDRVRQLETDLETSRSLAQTTKPVLSDDFKDLSDEIKEMQATINYQKKLIDQKDSQLSDLTRKQVSSQDQIAAKSDRDQQLIKELAAKEQQLQQLEATLKSYRDQSQGYASVDQRNRELEARVRDLMDERDQQKRAADQYASQLQTRQPVASYSPPSAPITTTTPSQPNTVTTTGSGWVPVGESSVLPGSSAPASRASTAPVYVQPRTTVERVSYQSRSPEQPRKPRVYKVRPGDTLSGISQKVYGTPDKWRDIYQYNRQILKNSNALKIGQILYLP